MRPPWLPQIPPQIGLARSSGMWWKAVTGLCRTINFNSPSIRSIKARPTNVSDVPRLAKLSFNHSIGRTHNRRFQLKKKKKIPCFPSIFCHPLPTIFLLVPPLSEIWICRQSNHLQVLYLVFDSCSGAGTFEILVANHSPIPYFI